MIESAEVKAKEELFHLNRSQKTGKLKNLLIP